MRFAMMSIPVMTMGAGPAVVGAQSLAATHGEPTLPVEVGRRRSARLGQSLRSQKPCCAPRA